MSDEPILKSLKERTSLTWFWNALFKNKRAYLHIVTATFFTNFFVLVIPIFMMNVYNTVIPNQSVKTLWALAIGAVLFFVFDFILRLLSNYLLETISNSADLTLSSKIFSHLLNLQLSYKPSSAGALANYFKEFEMLREFFNSLVLVSLIEIPFVFLYLAVIWLIGGPVVFVTLTFIIISLIASYLMERPIKNLLHESMGKLEDKQAFLVETILGIESIKAMSAESYLQEKWQNILRSNSIYQARARKYLIYSSSIMFFLQQLSIIFVVIYSVHLYFQGSMTVGGIIAISLLNNRAVMLGHLTFILSRLGRTRDILGTVDKLLKLPSEKSPGRHLLQREIFEGNLEFKRVTFFYPQQRVAALENVSLKIEANEQIALIGQIGSGKSTLLKLIAGFYTPHSGTILIDGIDLFELDPILLRRKVYYVSAQDALFQGTLRDNLLLAKPDASDEEIIRAAKLSGAEHFIQRHPLGYDMPLGERGSYLSSGQRQTISLARAFLINPNILLLDEPTHLIDFKLESLLIQNIQEFTRDKTLIVATHRTTLLNLVTRIVVLEQGHIIADGGKEEILDKISKAQSQK